MKCVWMKVLYDHQGRASSIFKPHSRLRTWHGSTEESRTCVLKIARRTFWTYQNIWKLFVHLHSCQSKTLSCEPQAASHYAKSNRAVELSSVSQCSVSKYSLTAHIGGDLEVFLCLDIKTTKTTVLGIHRHDIPCLQREQNKQLPKPQIHRIWRNVRICFGVILSEMSICVCVCKCMKDPQIFHALEVRESVLAWNHIAAVLLGNKSYIKAVSPTLLFELEQVSIYYFCLS